jgi:hypothetical protein
MRPKIRCDRWKRKYFGFVCGVNTPYMETFLWIIQYIKHELQLSCCIMCSANLLMLPGCSAVHARLIWESVKSSSVLDWTSSWTSSQPANVATHKQLCQLTRISLLHLFRIITISPPLMNEQASAYTSSSWPVEDKAAKRMNARSQIHEDHVWTPENSTFDT